MCNIRYNNSPVTIFFLNRFKKLENKLINLLGPEI